MNLLATASNSVLAQVVNQELMNGALDEVIALLPVAIPTMIGFIAVRKGIGFIRSILASA